MIKIDDIEYRNLEEQVGKNQEDIKGLKFGLDIVGRVDSIDQIPAETEAGGTYLVGTAAPYNICTKIDDTTLLDLGTLASTVTGPKGEKGDTGETGKGVSSAYLDGTTLHFTFTDGTDVLLSDIEGPRGLRGLKGDTGETGPKGDKGDQGERGETGVNFNIIAKLLSISQLPDPEDADANDAYLIQTATGYDMYIIVGGGWFNSGPMHLDDEAIAALTLRVAANEAAIEELPTTDGDNIWTANNVFTQDLISREQMYQAGTTYYHETLYDPYKITKSSYEKSFNGTVSNLKTYTYMLPNNSGTVALTSDLDENTGNISDNLRRIGAINNNLKSNMITINDSSLLKGSRVTANDKDISNGYAVVNALIGVNTSADDPVPTTLTSSTGFKAIEEGSVFENFNYNEEQGQAMEEMDFEKNDVVMTATGESGSLYEIQWYKIILYVYKDGVKISGFDLKLNAGHSWEFSEKVTCTSNLLGDKIQTAIGVQEYPEVLPIAYDEFKIPDGITSLPGYGLDNNRVYWSSGKYEQRTELVDGVLTDLPNPIQTDITEYVNRDHYLAWKNGVEMFNDDATMYASITYQRTNLVNRDTIEIPLSLKDMIDGHGNAYFDIEPGYTDQYNIYPKSGVDFNNKTFNILDEDFDSTHHFYFKPNGTQRVIVRMDIKDGHDTNAQNIRVLDRRDFNRPVIRYDPTDDNGYDIIKSFLTTQRANYMEFDVNDSAPISVTYYIKG